MQIEQLLHVVLDPTLGAGWPAEAGAPPDWPVGARWRVEYSFCAPAVPAAALALGSEVHAIWRYEVVAHEQAADGTPLVVVRASPEGAGGAGYHVLATYERASRRLLAARRFEGERELPLELVPLPPLEHEVTALQGGGFVRRFQLPEPPAAPELGEIEQGADLDALMQELAEAEEED